MAGLNYNQGYYPTGMGGANFSPYNYQTAVPMAQPQQTQQTGSIMMIQITNDDEVATYPVAAGTTVLLMNFNSKKFWLKSTSMSGVPEPLRKFTFSEEVTAQTAPSNGVSREEFDSLSKKIDKLLKDLGGTNNE